MADDETYHRTLRNMAGEMPKSHVQAWANEPASMARKFHIVVAYRKVGDGAPQQVALAAKPDQDFKKFATAWEKAYSRLILQNGRAYPFVNNDLRIVGHAGWFYGYEIIVPRGRSGPVSTTKLQSLINEGLPVFVLGNNPLSGYYDKYDDVRPANQYFLLTSMDGAVAGVFGFDFGAGIKEALAPWEYISIGRLAISLGTKGVRTLTNMVVARSTGRSVARGATKELTEVLAQRATGQKTVEEMEEYLLDILANRPDLRRLMAARVLTGPRLDAEVKAILKEWEFQVNWNVKIVARGVAQKASGRKGNYIWQNAKDRTLYIEKHVADDPAKFLNEVRHELVAHALGGGQGTVVPFIQMAGGQIWNAQTILEAAVQRGDVKTVLAFFAGGR